jgi:hypothetical protein
MAGHLVVVFHENAPLPIDIDKYTDDQYADQYQNARLAELAGASSKIALAWPGG